MKRLLFVLFACLSLSPFRCPGFVLAAPAANEALTIRIGGDAAPIDNIFRRIKPDFERQTGIQLQMVEIAPAEVWAHLATDRIDVAATALSYNEWQQAALADTSNPLQAVRQLNFRVIGNDVITVLAHPAAAVADTLTVGQVRDIFTGRITNWQAVGGEDLPIIVVLGAETDTLTANFQKQVLFNEEFPAEAERVATSANMKRKVIDTPGAVTIGTFAEAFDSTVLPILYPAPRRALSMFWKQHSEHEAAIQQLYTYITKGDGEKYTMLRHNLYNHAAQSILNR